MGSGNKRKGNDILHINRPQKSADGGDGCGCQKDINQMCPPAFDVGIKLKRRLPNETAVTRRGNDLFILGEFVGKLSTAHVKIITECGGEGIHYTARLLNKGEKSYARFVQNT